MGKVSKVFEKIDLMHVFTIIVGTSIIFTIIYNFLLDGLYLRNEETNFGLIWDFILHVMGMANKGSYPNYILVFPPFAYMIYNFFYHSDATIQEGAQYSQPLALDTYHIYYFCVVVQFILYAIILSELFKKEKIGKRVCFILTILLSYPMYYKTIYMGNDILTTVLLLFVAMIILRKEKIKESEKIFAMILIALASGLKLTPAIFGLEFVRRKDYKHAGILILMGLVVFIVPFFYFDGFETMKKYFEVMFNFNRLSGPQPTSIYYFINVITKRLFNIDIFIRQHLFLTIQILFLIINFYLYFISKKSWQRYLVLGFICGQFISQSYIYYILYYLVGMIFFFLEENITIYNAFIEKKYISIIYVLLFSMAFSLYLLPKSKDYVHFLWTVILMIVVYYDVIVGKVIKKQVG